MRMPLTAHPDDDKIRVTTRPGPPHRCSLAQPRGQWITP